MPVPVSILASVQLDNTVLVQFSEGIQRTAQGNGDAMASDFDVSVGGATPDAIEVTS